MLLVVFFAAYLVDKRELLASGTRHFGRMALPDPKHLGPLAARVGVLDPGHGAAEGPRVVAPLLRGVRGDALHRDRALVVPRRRARHVPRRCLRRVPALRPRAGPRRAPGSTRGRCRRRRASSSCSRCSRSGSGGFAGTGLGLGQPAEDPERVDRLRVRRPSARSSACSARSRCCILFLLLVGSGFRIAIQADRPFSKLFAAGLTTIIGVQTFVIMGGVIRVIPLTGVTLPFISYGGSSLIANFVIIALAVAHLRRDRRATPRCRAPSPPPAPRAERDAAGRAGGASVNRAIRRVGYAVTVLILLLVAQLTYLQVVDANNLANDPQQRAQARSRTTTGPRGEILTADGQIVARVGAHRHGDFKYHAPVPARSGCSRTPPATSRSSIWRDHGRRGVVQRRPDRPGHEPAARRTSVACSTGRRTPATWCCQLHRDRAAGRPPTRRAPNGLRGRARRRRRVRCSRCTPTPRSTRTGSSVHNTPVRAERVQRHQQSVRPSLRCSALVPRPVLAGLDVQGGHEQGGHRSRHRDAERPGLPRVGRLPDPAATSTTLRQLRRRGRAAGPSSESFIISCNATFAALGYQLGDQFAPAMDECGIDDDAPPIDLAPDAVASVGPRVGVATAPAFALAGIGQGDVFTSPLQMALIAAGIANGGVIMQPHVVKEIQNSDGKVVRTIDPEAVEDVHVADHRADAHQHDGAGRRTRAPAPRRRSTAWRSPARPVPRRPASRARRRTRGSSPSRRPTRPVTRWR